MKNLFLLLVVAGLLALAAILAVTLWGQGTMNLAHLTEPDLRPIGGMTAAEVRELVE
jgi:hypothetical protein